MWIGPEPATIETKGDKINARNLMAEAGMPVADGTPDPVMDADSAAAQAERIGYPVMLKAAAGTAARAIGYRGAGTIECLVDTERQDFVFLEMNTRLQVEHPVTELVWDIDLVAEQLRVAAGERPGFDPDTVRPAGHALELRIYAEDPRTFLPGPGKLTTWRPPTGDGIRVDSGYDEGDTVTQYYDPLMAKLCVWGTDRPDALDRARKALERFDVEGPKCNLPFFTELLQTHQYDDGTYDTETVNRIRGG